MKLVVFKYKEFLSLNSSTKRITLFLLWTCAILYLITNDFEGSKSWILRTYYMIFDTYLNPAVIIFISGVSLAVNVVEVLKWKVVLKNQSFKKLYIIHNISSIWNVLGFKFFGEGMSKFFLLKLEYKTLFKSILWPKLVQTVPTGIIGFVVIVFFYLPDVSLAWKLLLSLFLLTLIGILYKKFLSSTAINSLMSLSFLKYALYIFQYLIILYGSSHTVLVDIFRIVPAYFFTKMFIPSFHFLADIGVREVGFLFVSKFAHFEAEHFVAASITIWLLNKLIPALLGVTLSIFNNREW